MDNASSCSTTLRDDVADTDSEPLTRAKLNIVRLQSMQS
jgi:hypothetical protein